MRIETARLVLRDFTPDDEPAMWQANSDPRTLEFYAEVMGTREETQRLQAMFLAYQRDQPRRRFQLAVTVKGSDLAIGSVGIRRKPENDFDAEVGYGLHPDYWGHGYATEAATALVAYGFETLLLHRVSSWCIAGNVRSARVLEKIGLRLEGRLRDNEHFKGRYWDTLQYGLLRAEWDEAISLNNR